MLPYQLTKLCPCHNDSYNLLNSLYRSKQHNQEHIRAYSIVAGRHNLVLIANVTFKKICNHAEGQSDSNHAEGHSDDEHIIGHHLWCLTMHLH